MAWKMRIHVLFLFEHLSDLYLLYRCNRNSLASTETQNGRLNKCNYEVRLNKCNFYT